MMESEVMGNYHASFGERDGETRTMRIVKVRTVPTPLSPVLANMALDGLERTLRKKFPHSGARATKGKKKQVNLVRCADDFVITGNSKEVLEDEVKPLVIAYLQPRGLELSEEKTRITHIEEGFDFLGQHVRKYNGKFLIKPSKKNVKTFLTDIRKVIKDNKQATAYGLIATLNPKIRGWANYHLDKAFYRVSREAPSQGHGS